MHVEMLVCVHITVLQIRRLEVEKQSMETFHSKAVAELESRLLEQEVKHKAEIAEQECQIRRIHRSAEERLNDVQMQASDEKESLLAQIRFVSVVPVGSCRNKIRVSVSKTGCAIRDYLCPSYQCLSLIRI